MTYACGQWGWSYMCRDWLSLSRKVKTELKLRVMALRMGKEDFFM